MRAWTLDETSRRITNVAEGASNPADLFGDIVAALRRTMPVDGWCGHTLDPATALPTGGTAREGYAAELVPRLLEIEYGVGDVNPFDELLHRSAPVGVLHKATGGVPERSPRYREVVTPSGYEHELRVVFRHQKRPWGALVLLRAEDSRPFAEAEASLMGSLTTIVATHIKRLLLEGYVESGGLPARPGLLLLDSRMAIETVTLEASRWIQQLSDGTGELPLTVVALAASAADANGRAVRSRVKVHSGEWATLTAWSLGGDRIAVSLESTAPHDLTALSLAAYSLSAREREVVELVLLGYPTAAIAKQLYLSPHTVQDHLKSVFDKVGVRSRRELAADLFFRHYLPRIERGSSLTSDGWFAES